MRCAIKRCFSSNALLISCFVSFFDILLIPYILKTSEGTFFTNSIISLFTFIGLSYLIYRLVLIRKSNIIKCHNTKFKYCSAFFNGATLFGVILAFFQMAAALLSEAEINHIIALVGGICLAYTYTLFFSYVFFLFDSCENRQLKTDGCKVYEIYNKYGILIGAMFILVCWGIIWLASYPGFFCYDAGWQLKMYESDSITQHHPVIHTLIIGGVVNRLFRLLGDYNKAIAIYIFGKMIINDFIITYALMILSKTGVRKRYILLAQIYFALFPTVAFFMECSTKDSLFSSVLMLLLVILYAIESDTCGENVNILWVSAFACLLIAMLFRNNAIYAFLFSAIVLFVLKKRIARYYKRFLALLLWSIVIVVLLNRLITFLGFEKGPFREMFSVPVQQIAEVYNSNRDSIMEDELAYLEELAPEEVWENYDPHFSDNVRWSINDYKLKTETTQFIRVWYQIGKRNVGLYVKAFLCLTQYAWDTSAIIDIYKDFPYYDYSSTPKSYFAAWTESPGNRDSKIPSLNDLIWTISRDISFEKIPVLSMLFSVAFANYVLIFTVIYSVHAKRKEYYCSWLLIGTMVASILLGPFVIPRYYLPVFMNIPLCLISIFQKNERENE